MRIANNEDIEAPPNLMPLIDMVFLLLIFFLVASSLNQEEYEQPVQLPHTAKAVRPISDAPRELIINILGDGSMKVVGRPIERKELADTLVAFAQKKSGRKVYIRCDDRAKFQYFAGVVDLASSCGISPVKIAYLPKPKATVIPD
ncbi:MAG: biopolymer transporter ExbD [Planctomycetes bacterium]|nr:biopolymer transporter ExbD [Planctomycetota bacterium]